MVNEKQKPISYGSIWRMIAPMLRPYSFVIIVIVIFATVISVLSVAEPYIYGAIIDSVTQSVTDGTSATDGFRAIVPYLMQWAVVVLAVTALTAIHAWIVWYLGNRINYHSGEGMFRKMLSLTVARFQDERAGAMLHRFNTADEALWTLNGQAFRSVLQSVITFIVVVAVGTYLDWRLTVTALAIVPVILIMGIWNQRVSVHHQEVMSEKWEETSGLVGDAFSNITTVQSDAGEESIVKKFLKEYLLVQKEQLRLNVQWAVLDAGGGGTFVIGRLLLFFVGIKFVLSGTTTLGTLVMFLGFAGSMYGTVQTVMNEIPMATKSLNRLSRAARIWDEVPEVRDTPDARRAPALRGEVQFENVSFGYREGDKNVLRSVGFTVPAGQTFAIVGESGAGKSTLAKLMVRFADPTKGFIRFDGVDLREMTLATLRPQVGFVMQENMLFHETILYNMRFARPNASREDVIEAAKRAQAHEFISKLPKGYDTVVGERGVKLSGGQKQRIALARVLLANPPILVLDEATSALDSKTEHDLQQALREVMKNRTTIVIAHRLSTVMDADNILVMDKGRIVDQGKHEDLIKRDNLYRQFWEIQAGGYV